MMALYYMALRCIRHFAIYEQRWPSRVPPHGTSSATPREEIAVVEHRHTVRIAPRVSSIAASRARNSVRDEQEEEEERPAKKQKAISTCIDPNVSSSMRTGSKMSYSAYRAVTSVCDEQVEEEDRPSKKRKAGDFASKRQKAQERTSRGTKFVHKLLARRATEAYRARKAPEPIKRRRGRPRLSSPRAIARAKVKVEELQVEIPVVAQPRATNGRFGKKDKSGRKSREFSGGTSTVARSIEDDDDLELKTRTSPRHKRGIDAVEDLEESPKKKSASKQDLDGGNDIIEVVRLEGPAQKVLPRPASGFRGGRLFSNPNPLRFALHAWAGPLILDESSSDDEKQPETPEDGLSSTAEIAPAEELSPSIFLSSILPRAPLTYKPSPFVFAKNRWNATSGTFNQVADNNRRASTNSARSEDNLWLSSRTSHASSEEEVILFPSLLRYL